MKKIILSLWLIVPLVASMAQSPGFLNYQAVLRDNSGDLMSNETVNIRTSVIDNTSDGDILYQETHNKTANSYGLVDLMIGNGTVVSGSFSQINWSVNKKYLKIEVDAGSGYISMGTVQLVSVPYALYANSAGNLGDNNIYSAGSDTLFVVKDYDGNVVFAVFPDGAQVIVNETAKGKVGGFAVSGRNPSKATDVNILNVTMDSTRIYVTDTLTNKGKVGGFAVSGRNPSKNMSTEILFVTADSTRVYVNDDPQVKGKVGGFAVSGRNPSKGTINDYLQVTKDSTRVYIEESATKGKVGGFAVSGRNPSKGTTQSMFVTTMDSTRIFTQDTIGGFGVYDNRGTSSSSYMTLTPLNYFIGHNSGQKIEVDSLNPGMGKYNTFFGYNAGENTVSGFKNIFMGYQAGQANVSGGWNVFIGNNAGANSQTGLSNIFIGDQAGYNFNGGVQNVFIGNEAGYSGVDVYGNLFVGNSAGRSNTTGNSNTYVGISAAYNTTGSDNAFLGNTSGFSNTGSNNTYLGSQSGIYSGVGEKNVYIGYKAGYRSYGSRNVFIGTNANNTNFSSVNYSNSIAIGDSVIVTASNQIRIGNSNATSAYIQGAYNQAASGGTALYINSSGKIGTTVSSLRYKKDINDIEINTSNIYKLRPVSYTLLADNKRYFGLIAEEVAKVIPGLTEFVRAREVIQGSDSDEMIPNSVNYSFLSVLLLKEVQKHEETINNQTEYIKELKNKNNELEERIKRLEELMLK